MEETDAFIDQCQKIIHAHVEIAISCRKIREAARRLPPHTHPMIYKICMLAEDLDEDHYRDDGDTRHAHWTAICKLIDDFQKGSWHPTVWCMLAIYRATPQESISIKVTRQTGQIVIETTDDTLRTVVQDTQKIIKDDQTDEWYLHNLTHLLPRRTAQYTLMNTKVREILANGS